MQVFTLREFIMAVLSGGFLLGPVVFQLFDYFKLFPTLDAAAKRATVGAVCGVLGVIAWGLGVWLGYVPQPVDPTEVAEAVWSNGINMALAAFFSASLIHGYVTKPEADNETS